MSLLHVIYIPAALIAGFALGWMQGAKASKAELDRLRGTLEDVERSQAAQRLERARAAEGR